MFSAATAPGISVATITAAEPRAPTPVEKHLVTLVVALAKTRVTLHTGLVNTTLYTIPDDLIFLEHLYKSVHKSVAEVRNRQYFRGPDSEYGVCMVCI
jgi:hypothetical protein